MVNIDNKVLLASEGMMLTDGNVYGKGVKLGCNSKPENYYEITEDEYEKMLEQETEGDDE